MTTSTAAVNERQLLLAVVRGEANWRELDRLGVKPEFDAIPPRWWDPPSVPVVRVRARDLAVGFLIHRSSPEALREWAQAMEMCGCFDFSQLEGDPGGELLLEALWSAAVGEPIDGEALRTIHDLADVAPNVESAEGSSAAPSSPSPVEAGRTTN